MSLFPPLLSSQQVRDLRDACEGPCYTLFMRIDVSGSTGRESPPSLSLTRAIMFTIYVRFLPAPPSVLQSRPYARVRQDAHGRG